MHQYLYITIWHAAEIAQLAVQFHRRKGVERFEYRHLCYHVQYVTNIARPAS